MIEENEKKILDDLKNQHLSNYKNALKEIINNNTDSLVDEDISSLIKKPPLDSMDSIKQKLISLGKKEKIILDNENMEKLLCNYREKLNSKLLFIKNERKADLYFNIDNFEPKRENEIINIRHTQLENTNKKIKKEIKKMVLDDINELLEKIDLVYKNDEQNDSKKSINLNFSKYMKKTYVKQLMESISIKIMVKDRTLISGVSEQGERYLFTKNNSHIFKD